MNGRWLWAVAVSAGCDPFAAWPEPHEVFPWVYAPETDLADYETVRVETETWTPLVDLPETALYVQKSLYHKPSAPYDERVHFGMSRPAIPPLAAGDVTLSFVGDVMRFDGGWSTFADGVADRLDGAIRAGNLETPISASAPTDPDALADQFGLYAFNAPASLLDGLPLDLVQVNNNHALDVGDLGLEETVAAVSATGRVPIGMDANAAVATVGDLTIGYLSYTWGLNVQEPSAHDLHVVPFGHRDAPIDLGPVATQVAALRADGVGFVVVMVHWGYEFEYYPDPQFLQLGRELVGLGADLVVGSGPHAVEPAEVCEVNRPAAVPRIGRCAVRTDDGVPRTAAILYSLGDFGTELQTLPLEVGLIATVSVRAGVGVTGLGWDAVASTDSPDGGQVLVPLDALLDDPAYAAEDARLNMLLGAGWRR